MSKTVLTLDDSATMRKMVNFTLSRVGYTVLEATDGPSALELLRTKQIDMVITDLNMPGMDGIAFTKNVRALAHHARTPVVLLTTNSDADSKSAGRAAGATGWMLKPFTPDQLLSLASKVIPL